MDLIIWGIAIIVACLVVWFYIYEEMDLATEFINANKCVPKDLKMEIVDAHAFIFSEPFRYVENKMQRVRIKPQVKLAYALSLYVKKLIKDNNAGKKVHDANVRIAKLATKVISTELLNVKENKITPDESTILHNAYEVVYQFDETFIDKLYVLENVTEINTELKYNIDNADTLDDAVSSYLSANSKHTNMREQV